MAYVTIFTPTYNRAAYLLKLYDSLLKQTCKDFEWYIVDGCSNDNTAELVEEFCAEGKMSIRFETNPHRSKYTALLNYAFKKTDSKLLFIVDSDDTITSDAVETIVENDKKYDTDANAGYFYLCEYPESHFTIKSLETGKRIHFIELSTERNDKVDTCCQVYKTELLKKCEFPNYHEEFMPESVLWNKIDQTYKITEINKVIYMREYQADGYTKSGRKKNVNSPLGSMESNRYLLNAKIPFCQKIKANLLFSCYGLIAKKNISQLVDESTNKMFTILCMPVALCIAAIWSKKWKSD